MKFLPGRDGDGMRDQILLDFIHYTKCWDFILSVDISHWRICSKVVVLSDYALKRSPWRLFWNW